jgi:hypothetical protein
LSALFFVLAVHDDPKRVITADDEFNPLFALSALLGSAFEQRFIQALLYISAPAIFSQGYLAAFIKSNAFPFQPPPLFLSAVGIGQAAEFTPGIDHPVPGEMQFRRKGVQGISHLPGTIDPSGKPGDLSTSGDTSKRDFGNNVVYSFISG